MSVALKQGESVIIGRTYGRPPSEARVVAAATGAATFAGAPCKRGHAGTRYTSTRACVDCVREYGRRSMEGPFLLIQGS